MDAPGTAPQCGHVGKLPEGGYLCLPLIAHGEILGVLHLQSKGAGRPALSHQPLAQAFAERVALALANIQLRERFRAQSIRDPLTGLHNRRFLEETMAIEERRAKRSKEEIGIIMLDIDHFKRFNDTFGHDAGDAVLGAISRLLAAEVRQSDLACRYGGEEFVIVLPKAGLEMTRLRAESLRRKAAELQVEHRGRVLNQLTLSLGVAVCPAHGGSWQAALKAADVALYRAKNGGRNRVELATAEPERGAS